MTLFTNNVRCAKDALPSASLFLKADFYLGLFPIIMSFLNILNFLLPALTTGSCILSIFLGNAFYLSNAKQCIKFRNVNNAGVFLF